MSTIPSSSSVVIVALRLNFGAPTAAQLPSPEMARPWLSRSHERRKKSEERARERERKRAKKNKKKGKESPARVSRARLHAERGSQGSDAIIAAKTALNRRDTSEEEKKLSCPHEDSFSCPETSPKVAQDDATPS